MFQLPPLSSTAQDVPEQILDRALCPAFIQNALKLTINCSMNKHADRLVEMLKSHLEAGVTKDEMIANISHMDDFLTSCFRQRYIMLTLKESSGDEDAQDRPRSQLMKDTSHIKAIKKHSCSLTSDLRIKGTLVLDRLIESDILSEAGRQSIIKRKTIHEINSAFLKFCNGLSCSKFRETVLPALKRSDDNTNARLADEIETELEGGSTSSLNNTRCLSCKIQNTVNYRRLADRLYEKGVISDNMLQDLSSSHISNDSKWKQLMGLKKPKHISRALKTAYPDLYREMQLTPENITICACACSTEEDSDENMQTDGDSDVAKMSDLSTSTNPTSPPEVFAEAQPVFSMLLDPVTTPITKYDAPSPVCQEPDSILQDVTIPDWGFILSTLAEDLPQTPHWDNIQPQAPGWDFCLPQSPPPVLPDQGSVGTDDKLSEYSYPDSCNSVTDISSLSNTVSSSNHNYFADISDFSECQTDTDRLSSHSKNDFASWRRKPRIERKVFKGNHLWEFMLDLLNDPRYNDNVIQWENREAGIFRLVKISEVATIWGQRKKSRNMTSEKLLRALVNCRSAGYFKNNLFQKKRCFQFGPKAAGWK